MTRTKMIITASLLLGLGAVGTLTGVAGAAAPRQAQRPVTTQAPASPRVVRVSGQVQSVSSGGLVLQTGRNRTLNVNAGANTWVLVEKNGRCGEGQLSDIQAGKAARIAGMITSAANTVDARVIAQGACARQFAAAGAPGKAVGASFLVQHAAAGTVKSISGSTVTLTNAAGKEVTVNTSAQTVVLNNGFGDVSALKAGDEIQVFGRAERATTGNGSGATPPSAQTRTITAWAIHDASAKTRVALARVSAVNGNTITVRSPGKRIGSTVTLTGSTAYKAVTVTGQTVSVTGAAQSDLKAGENLLVEASISADGKTTTAASVIILPLGRIK